MHRAVGEEYPAQAVGFQPVAIEEDKAFAGLALQLQALAHDIKILAISGSGNGAQHLIAGQQLALAVAHLRQGDGVRSVAAEKAAYHQQQGDGEQAAASQIPAGAARVAAGNGLLFFRDRGRVWLSFCRERRLRLRAGVEHLDSEIGIELQ